LLVVGLSAIMVLPNLGIELLRLIAGRCVAGRRCAGGAGVLATDRRLHDHFNPAHRVGESSRLGVEGNVERSRCSIRFESRGSLAGCDVRTAKSSRRFCTTTADPATQ